MRTVRALGALVCLGILWAQPPSSSVWDGVYTEQQSERGKAAYAGECARCHGTDLTGGESAPPLAGFEFLANWNGLTVGDLFERIRISMPADSPGRLSSELNSDIIAYMLNVNQFPPGETELERRAMLLNQIKIETFRPDDAQ